MFWLAMIIVEILVIDFTRGRGWLWCNGFCPVDDVEISRIKSAIQKEALEAQNKKKLLGDIVKGRAKSAAPSRGETAFSQSTSRAFTSRIGSMTSAGAVRLRHEHLYSQKIL